MTILWLKHEIGTYAPNNMFETRPISSKWTFCIQLMNYESKKSIDEYYINEQTFDICSCHSTYYHYGAVLVLHTPII